MPGAPTTPNSSIEIVPCLWIPDRIEEAALFYHETFHDAHIEARSHYPKNIDNPAGKPRGAPLVIDLRIDGQRFTLLNGDPHVTPNPSISFFVHTDSQDETDTLHAALTKDGKELLPLDAYPWSERYAWVEDRYGVSWQIIQGRREGQPKIVPCLMFVRDNHGKASDAIDTYLDIFGGERGPVEHFDADEGDPAHIKHGRFRIGPQAMVAMDGGEAHEFQFDDGVSLQVLCDTQDEVDRYWDAIAKNGEPGPCGWIRDTYGLWWQIVPRVINDMFARDDEAAMERAFQAMLTMGKLDIETLQGAYDGTLDIPSPPS